MEDASRVYSGSNGKKICSFIQPKTGSSDVSSTEKLFVLANSINLFTPQISCKNNVNDNT